MQSTCVREKRLICSNIVCKSRICRKCFKGFPISSVTTINPPLVEDSGAAGNENLDTESDNGFDDDRWHDDERGVEDKVSTDDSGEYPLGEGSNDADKNYRDDDIKRGDILVRTHMEDYDNRLDDYVNGHEQDDDDGDIDGDSCYGIHESIRRRM